MTAWVALLRGINVGGKNRLPMRDLVRVLKTLGCEDVGTYIQSGNVVFRSPVDASSELATTIAAGIDVEFGFRPSVLVLSREQMRRAIEANPFPDATTAPTTLHLFFLTATPAELNEDGLNQAAQSSERWQLCGTVFYLHAPDGIGRSVLAAKAERLLGVPTTARNWRTAHRVWEMVTAY